MTLQPPPISREETQARLDRRAEAGRAHPLDGNYLVADRIEQRVAERADHPFLIYGDLVLTYAEANAEMNRIAHAIAGLGLTAGDTCALYMENRPAFLITAFGLAKLGVQVALLNYDATGKALEHALSVTGAKAVIVGEERLANFEGADLGGRPLWLLRDPDAAPSAHKHLATLDLSALAPSQPTGNPPASLRAGLTAGSNAFYIFTSGTTGLPKAAYLSHARWLSGADARADMMRLRSTDVFYCFLPMFHGAAMMSLVSSAITRGGTIVIRRKFSASNFWGDVRRYNISVVQYVGEICRYLLSRPEQPDDRQHSIRQMIGTGMGEVWERFQTRFGIPEIMDGYGATEANLTVPNIDNKPGACGRIPIWDRSNVRFIRYDVESDSHPRDANGHFILCEPGEIGEAIGKISEHPTLPGGRFEGYTSAEATEAKILRNVFEDGDAWWRSGDLLRHDSEGYVWFVDRIGDTFRWKSENVSTQEVAETLTGFPDLELANVYGVKVPDHGGRAGMAALTLADGATFDPEAFYRFATAGLAPYAVPLFVRIASAPDLTASLKLRKVDLQRQGYDPDLAGEPLYVLDRDRSTYQVLTPEALDRLRIPPFRDQENSS